jgi:flagellar biosynthetic protein FlhB
MADGPDRDEKTEEATARRRGEARDKGQVAFSSELMVVTMLGTAVAAMMVAGSNAASAAGALVHESIAAMTTVGRMELDPADAGAALGGALRSLAPGVLLIVGPMVLVGLLTGFVQVGFHIAPKALETDLNKLDPITGFKRLFNARSWMRTFFGGLKVIVVGTVMIAVTLAAAPEAIALVDTGARPLIAAIGYVLLRTTLAGLVVLAILAVFDVYFQRSQHTKDLRMTKKEVRDEARNSDGDPLVKSKIRQVQRELASRRMMQDVPTATVVVTNPTHVAVALRYDETRQNAPIVVAKGLDEVAQAIKALAAEHGVILHEEAPLARALHRACEIGDPIPAELFEAVARVLAYVYRVQGRAPVGA